MRIKYCKSQISNFKLLSASVGTQRTLNKLRRLNPRRFFPSVRIILFLILAFAMADVCFGEAKSAKKRAAKRTKTDAELSALVGDALLSALAGDRERMEDNLRRVKELDGKLEKERGMTTGLSDNIEYLIATTIDDRDQFIEAQEKLLKKTDDESLKKMIRYRLDQDELIQARDLNEEGVYNDFADGFNVMSRTTYLAATGNIPALLHAGLYVLFNLDRVNQTTIRERKQLVLYEKYSDKHSLDVLDLGKTPALKRSEGADEDNKKLRDEIRSLRKKIDKDAYNAAMDAGDNFMDAKDFAAAGEEYWYALYILPDSEDAKKCLDKAREQEAKLIKDRKASLTLSHRKENFTSKAEQRHYEDILFALAAGDTARITKVAESFARRFPDSTYLDEVQYAKSVALDLEGKHEQAKTLLKELASDMKESNAAFLAEAMLDNPTYNLYGAFQSERKEFRNKTRRYILTGQISARSGVPLAASQIATQGVQAANFLSTLYVFGGLARGIQTLIVNPIPKESIVDSGLRYLARYPSSERAPEVHKIIANIYEEVGEYESALYHYEAADLDSEKLRKRLRNKMAKKLMTRAEEFKQANDTIGERRCYERVLKRYSDSKSAKKAKKKLAAMGPETPHTTLISKAILWQYPSLWGKDGLGLQAELFDDDLENGELAEQAFALSPNEQIKLYYANENEEPKEETRDDVKGKRFSRIKAIVDQIEYEKKVKKWEVYRDPNFWPLQLRGAVGSEGLLLYPKLNRKKYSRDDRELYK